MTYLFREAVPFAGMLAAECINVGTSTLYKAAVSKGLNYHAFMVYSFAISALVLLPPACLVYRKTPLPPPNTALFAKFFILGFLCFVTQLCGLLGIQYSNPTMGSAMSNLTPALSFFLAVLLRMEKFKLTSLSSQAKVIGAVVSISGALVVVLYKGHILINGNRHNLLQQLTETRSSWVLGGVLSALCYMVASVFNIYQRVVLREYPAEFIMVFFNNFSAFLCSVPVCIALEPDLTSWKVPADIRLLSILCSGTFGIATLLMIYAWGIRLKGPVYVTMFRPVSIAIATFAGVLLLSDDLYLGSVIGSIIIVVGLYTTMWGKVKENIEEISMDPDESSSAQVIAPLLNKV